MDLIFEIIIELFLEGGMEISSNKKISRRIRYPILAIIILFFAIVILGILIIGISLLKENVIVALFIIFIHLFTKYYINFRKTK